MQATMKDKAKTSRELPGQIVAVQIAQAEDNVRAKCGKVESIKPSQRTNYSEGLVLKVNGPKPPAQRDS